MISVRGQLRSRIDHVKRADIKQFLHDIAIEAKYLNKKRITIRRNELTRNAKSHFVLARCAAEQLSDTAMFRKHAPLIFVEQRNTNHRSATKFPGVQVDRNIKLFVMRHLGRDTSAAIDNANPGNV